MPRIIYKEYDEWRAMVLERDNSSLCWYGAVSQGLIEVVGRIFSVDITTARALPGGLIVCTATFCWDSNPRTMSLRPYAHVELVRESVEEVAFEVKPLSQMLFVKAAIGLRAVWRFEVEYIRESHGMEGLIKVLEESIIAQNQRDSWSFRLAEAVDSTMQTTANVTQTLRDVLPRQTRSTVDDYSRIVKPFPNIFASKTHKLEFFLPAALECNNYAPYLTVTPGISTSSCFVHIESLCFVLRSCTVTEAACELLGKAREGILQAISALKSSCPSGEVAEIKTFFFHPVTSTLAFPIRLVFPLSSDGSETHLLKVRTATKKSFGFSGEQQLFRLVQELDWNPDIVPGGSQHLVQGAYGYYHYMQDGFNDKVWGCAYRSLQTLWSWLLLQGYTYVAVPTHIRIQEILVELEDKPDHFIGSNEWIGAIELSMILDTIDIQAKIMNLTSGREFASRGRELAHHFDTHGSPVMIGGGVLAYTLLGVDWNESTGDLAFLILDPHYVGRESIATIIEKGWCGWKRADLFSATDYYNLCMPQRPQFEGARDIV